MDKWIEQKALNKNTNVQMTSKDMKNVHIFNHRGNGNQNSSEILISL
jgi:hypothetical protein